MPSPCHSHTQKACQTLPGTDAVCRRCLILILGPNLTISSLDLSTSFGDETALSGLLEVYKECHSDVLVGEAGADRPHLFQVGVTDFRRALSLTPSLAGSGFRLEGSVTFHSQDHSRSGNIE